MATTTLSIRVLTASTIVAAATSAGGNVFNSRSEGRPLGKEELPAVIVASPSTRFEEGRHGGIPHWRQIENIRVECHAQCPETFGANAAGRDAEAARLRDVLEGEVLTALLVGGDGGGGPWLAQFEYVHRMNVTRGWDAASSHRIAVSIIEFDCQYDRAFDATVATTLDKITVDIDLIEPNKDGTPGPDGTIEVKTEVDF